MKDPESRCLIIKQLAYKSTNVIYQAALTSFRKKSVISDHIRNCWEILTSYTQELGMAAALQGKTGKYFLSQHRNLENGKGYKNYD